MEIDIDQFEGHFMAMKKEGGGKPARIHRSRKAVESEARRLSRKNNGETFLIMQIVGRAKAITEEPETIS